MESDPSGLHHAGSAQIAEAAVVWHNGPCDEQRQQWYCMTDLATKERRYDVGDPDYVVLHKIWAMRTTTGKEGHSEDNQNALGKIIKKQKNESIMIIKKK